MTEALKLIAWTLFWVCSSMAFTYVVTMRAAKRAIDARPDPRHLSQHDACMDRKTWDDLREEHRA